MRFGWLRGESPSLAHSAPSMAWVCSAAWLRGVGRSRPGPPPAPASRRAGRGPGHSLPLRVLWRRLARKSKSKSGQHRTLLVAML